MRHVMMVLALCSILACVAVCADDDAPEWKPLMDSETLDGWHAVGDGEWTVEDGEFVGRANNEALYGLLVSDDTFGDFTVKFQFKSPNGDSGFYIRTVIEEPEKANGLQVQVGPAGSGCGGIYESYGRGWLSQPKADDEKEYVKAGEWNEMVISAIGGDITVSVNGTETAKLEGDESRPEGQLALQMHSGCVMEVRFKDIRILEAGEGE